MPALLKAPLLTLRFTKLSNDRHRLSFLRADGSGETVELETRSFLVHDLLHLAVESEAQLLHGVFGRLADGATYATLAANDMTAAVTQDTRELHLVERIVGPLTSLVQGRMDTVQFLSNLRTQLTLMHEPMPDWLNETFVENVQERYRKLAGQWKSTPFGEMMEVHF